MEELFRNENLQLALIPVAGMLLFFLFIGFVGVIAHLAPESRYTSRRRSDRSHAQQQPIRRPSRVPYTVARPLQRNGHAYPQMRGNGVPYWQLKTLPAMVQPPPPALPESSLPQLCAHDDDEDDDEPTNPFINVNRLSAREEIVLTGVPVYPTLIPADATGQLLKRLLSESDAADWLRAILLRDEIPVGYPGMDYSECVCEQISEQEIEEMLDLECATETVETRDLNEEEEKMLAGFVYATPVVMIE